jgi:hypothetical protein
VSEVLNSWVAYGLVALMVVVVSDLKIREQVADGTFVKNPGRLPDTGSLVICRADGPRGCAVAYATKGER